ncbi:hypothetical protein FNH22_31345 [Fulvivirga sp. M361]|uniref:hypothetical protein n=1 Tax=Fulvivirga sp. M361 TaxID=2594266 RepID=UPI00117B7BFE|nr:hypothetical protein [Fulvivirga sp. M361]TRX45816.1 hypothetical protein FNH22_31345 [Fulvivirga sp. M361]
MDELRIHDVTRRLQSKAVEDYYETIDEVSSFLTKLTNILLDDFKSKEDLVRADVLFNYLGRIHKSLYERLEGELDSNSRFYLLLFLWMLGDKSILNEFLKFSDDEDIDKSLQVINKLSEEKVENLKEILLKKLENPDFQKPDYLNAILLAAKKNKVDLPDSFLKIIPEKLPWGLKNTLEQEFNLKF